MGYRSPIHLLELPDFQGETPEESLQVKVIAPSAREASDLNAGRREVAESDGATRQETSAEFMLRAMRYLAPKIRFWNLEDEEEQPIRLPREVSGVTEEQVAHLMEQDENIVLAIYSGWREVGLPKKADTDEGKDSETPSTDGPGASPSNGTPVDLRELESQIPM